METWSRRMAVFLGSWLALTPLLADSGPRGVRATCAVQAVRAVKIAVPQIQGQTSMMILTGLIPNGSKVKAGDLIATFDAAPQMDAAREAQAKFEDLGHQVEQKMAENRANAEKRKAELRQAEADLAKAELDLTKGPILSPIDLKKSEAAAQGARIHGASLKKSIAFREKAESAALRVLELQRDRQKIAMQRAQDNIKKLEIRAPLEGMVAHEYTYRGGSYGPAQVGDQLYRNNPLASIFDPSEMQVRCSIGEPDVTAVRAGCDATVYLDAYPDIALPARFLFVSPVASSGLGTSVKFFLAYFSIEKQDPHLLPDLSASVALTIPPDPETRGAK